MTKAMTEKTPTEKDITAQDVLGFLKSNPKFLQNNPQAVDLLTPPKSADRKVKDFMSFMVEKLKQDKEKVVTTARTLVENARSNMNNQTRIQNVVLRLLEATTFDEFIHIITMDMAAMLDTDISVLVVESDGGTDIPHIHNSGIRVVPKGTIDKWMGGKSALLQSNIAGIEVIYGGAYTLVQSQALLRVDISMNTPPAILAFGSRDPMAFEDGQATEQISFLARVVERQFRTWLHLPS